MDAVIGQTSALLVALSFSITSVCYTLAGRKLTAVTSIALSLPVSGVLLLGVHRVTQGVWLPVGASPQRWAVLGISGILAFVISNFFMLKAYQPIGPRLTMLVASFAPIGGALLAWFFLGQALPANIILGIAHYVHHAYPHRLRCLRRAGHTACSVGHCGGNCRDCFAVCLGCTDGRSFLFLDPRAGDAAEFLEHRASDRWIGAIFHAVHKESGGCAVTARCDERSGELGMRGIAHFAVQWAHGQRHFQMVTPRHCLAFTLLP